MSNTPKYPCGVCGRRDIADRMIYSAHTKEHYCWPGKCKADKRRRRAPKAVTA